MSEAEWLNATTPHQLLDLLSSGYSRRKLRHCVCACLRCVISAPLISTEVRALTFAELIADDEMNVDFDEWGALWDELDARTRIASSGPFDPGMLLIHAVSENIHEEARWLLAGFEDVGISAEIPLRVLREIFGNPFRPVSFSPDWRTDTAVTLARQMYDSREFSAMPILADALQDAGCDNDEVLSHCRDAKQAHVRGCWVVDGVLGKE